MLFFLQCQNIILQDIKSLLVDPFIVEQAIGCKKNNSIPANKKSWKEILKQLEKIRCKVKAYKKPDGNFHIQVIAPNNSYEFLLEDSKLEEKIKPLPQYYERSEMFQNLGNNIDHIFNSYFSQRDEKLRILEFSEGYKKIFHIYSDKHPIKLIKLHSTEKDDSFLNQPFFLISPITIKKKNLLVQALESFLFVGEVSDFTSKKFRESKEVILDHLKSLGYFEAEISHLILQDKEGALYIHFIIEPGVKRTLKNIQINFDFECAIQKKVEETIFQLAEEKMPTFFSLRELLDPLGVSVKSIDTLLKQKDKISMEINISQKKNDILLETITFKNINIPSRILYWHAAKNGLIMGKNIGDFNAYSGNLNTFMSLLQKHIGEPPEYSDNREDPTSIAITLTGKPQKFLRFITDKNDYDGFYKHILDFSNYNLSLNLIKLSKYGIAGKLFAFIISPGLRVKLAPPIEMFKQAGLCLPARLLFKHKNFESETEIKFNISFFSFLTLFIGSLSQYHDLLKNSKKATSSSESSAKLQDSSILHDLIHFITHDIIDPDLSTNIKYFNWLTHNFTINKEKLKKEEKLFFNFANNIQKYKSFSLNSGTTFSAGLEYKNPLSNLNTLQLIDSIGLNSSLNHSIKLNSRDSIVFNLMNSIFFSDKIDFLPTAYKLNVPFTGLSEEEITLQKIQQLFSLQIMLLHEAFDISQLTSPLNFSAKVRLGFTSLIHSMKFCKNTTEGCHTNFQRCIKLIPINFCIVLDLTEYLAYSFCIIIGPQGYSFVISKPAKQVNYFPSQKLERII